jgi:hypothetical protein
MRNREDIVNNINFKLLDAARFQLFKPITIYKMTYVSIFMPNTY